MRPIRTAAAFLLAGVALPLLVWAQSTDLTLTDAGRIVGPFQFPQRDGAALYKAICQGCHMPDARGATGTASYPALAHNPKVAAAGFVISRVLYGQGGMPAFNTQLDDRQVAALATYVRTHFDNHDPDPVTPGEVKSLRGQP